MTNQERKPAVMQSYSQAARKATPQFGTAPATEASVELSKSRGTKSNQKVLTENVQFAVAPASVSETVRPKTFGRLPVQETQRAAALNFTSGKPEFRPQQVYSYPQYYEQQFYQAPYYPPTQFRPPATFTPSNFKIPERKSNPIKIVNPNNMQEVAIPPASPGKSVSKPPVPSGSPASQAEWKTARTIEKPKLVLKNPATGEIVDIPGAKKEASIDKQQAIPPEKSKSQTSGGKIEKDGSKDMPKKVDQVPEVKSKEQKESSTNQTLSKPVEKQDFKKIMGSINLSDLHIPPFDELKKKKAPETEKPTTETYTETKQAIKPKHEVEDVKHDSRESKPATSENKFEVKKPALFELKRPAVDKIIAESKPSPTTIMPSQVETPTSAVTRSSIYSEPESSIVSDNIVAEPSEDGELLEDVNLSRQPSDDQYLAPDARLLGPTDKVSYPDSVKCELPDISLGVYSIDFLLLFQSIKLRPIGMPTMGEFLGDERRRGSSQRPPSMQRSNSSQYKKDRGFANVSRTKSNRGRPNRNSSMRRQPSQPVQPVELHKAENAWVITKKSELSDVERIVKEVKGALNKVTEETFDRLSEKICQFGIETEDILAASIDLIFEKAIDEPGFVSIYARLCHFMMLRLPEIHGWMQEEPSKGVYRRLLLKKCQNEFESMSKWTDEESGNNDSLRARDFETLTPEEKQALLEEDYERARVKRRYLGNVKFVGELFKMGMISDKIIHRCVVMLLKRSSKPEEELIESLCKLLTTIGKKMDESKTGHQLIVSYIEAITPLTENLELPSRIRFMVLDVLDLRKNNWKPRVIGSKKPTSSDARFSKSGGAKLPTRQQQAKDFDGWTSVKNRDTPSAPTITSSWSKSNDTEPQSEPINKFSILQRKESEAKTAEAQRIDPEIVLDKAFSNFRDSYDLKYFMEDIKDIMNEDTAKKTVTFCFQHLLDQNAKCAKKLELLLEELFTERFSKTILVETFSEFLVNFENDRADFPKGFDNFSELLLPLYFKGILDVDSIMSLQTPLKKYEGTKPVGPDFLAAFLSAMTPEEQCNFVFSAPVKEFWPAEPIPKTYNFWIKMKKLPYVDLMSQIGQLALESNESLPFLKNEYDLLSRGLMRYIGNATIYKDGPTAADHTQDMYKALKATIEEVRPVFSCISSEQAQLVLLYEATEYCKENYDYLNSFFRLFYDENIVSLEAYTTYQESNSIDELTGWFKYLETYGRNDNDNE